MPYSVFSNSGALRYVTVLLRFLLADDDILPTIIFCPFTYVFSCNATYAIIPSFESPNVLLEELWKVRSESSLSQRLTNTWRLLQKHKRNREHNRMIVFTLLGFPRSSKCVSKGFFLTVLKITNFIRSTSSLFNTGNLNPICVFESDTPIASNIMLSLASNPSMKDILLTTTTTMRLLDTISWILKKISKFFTQEKR